MKNYFQLQQSSLTRVPLCLRRASRFELCINSMLGWIILFIRFPYSILPTGFPSTAYKMRIRIFLQIILDIHWIYIYTFWYTLRSSPSSSSKHSSKYLCIWWKEFTYLFYGYPIEFSSTYYVWLWQETNKKRIYFNIDTDILLIIIYFSFLNMNLCSNKAITKLCLLIRFSYWT